MRPVWSWGRLAGAPHELCRLDDVREVPRVLRSRQPGIAYGMGRSYGDACLNPGGLLWETAGLDRLIAFDADQGRIVCEAGVQLGALQRLMLPRGWALAVSPGTQFVTVGGAIAHDVHGKNHHRRGTFGEHVTRLVLARTDGELLDCSPTRRSALFAATIGGAGLTGVVVEAELQLLRAAGPWLDIETLPWSGLDEFFAIADASTHDWEHTVSWFDCLAGRGGRGLFLRANPAPDHDTREPATRQWRVPFVPPVSLMNRATLRPFNLAWHHCHRRAGRSRAHYGAFLYPLDGVRDWNRLYGPKGFYQYQAVLPREAARDGAQAMLDAIARSRQGSFLAVLKTFGERPAAGMMSFPQPGVTLALDFPNRGAATLELFARLDAIVAQARGRLYLAKDARMPRALFEAGYPRLDEFLAWRDPGTSSGLSRRLMGV